jgi:hypothetical protein
MNVFKIEQPFENERKIMQSVIQVIELLNMYHAELARILGLQCADIGQLSSAQTCIKQDSPVWFQAVLFIEMYHFLFDHFDGDGVAMYHWLRADNKALNGTPHLLIVDDGELKRVHQYLKTSLEASLETSKEHSPHASKLDGV